MFVRFFLAAKQAIGLLCRNHSLCASIGWARPLLLFHFVYKVFTIMWTLCQVLYLTPSHRMASDFVDLFNAVLTDDIRSVRLTL